MLTKTLAAQTILTIVFSHRSKASLHRILIIVFSLASSSVSVSSQSFTSATSSVSSRFFFNSPSYVSVILFLSRIKLSFCSSLEFVNYGIIICNSTIIKLGIEF
ncbi:hypothetical protein QL285_002243 [Trifolium repens]|jgi:hypothetical protein|nr:hypothetical protein QL285_002243 [Trifolium repens]